VQAAEAAVQLHLREVVWVLNGLRYQLLGLAASLPPAPAEDPAADAEDPPSLAADLRTAIECALEDRLLPAIVDLAAAARLRPEEVP
jgi:hypothetical protein